MPPWRNGLIVGGQPATEGLFWCSPLYTGFQKQMIAARFMGSSFEQGRLRAAAEERWRYDDQSHWTGTCTEGRSQSPVDLVLGEAEVVNFDSVKFNNYHLTGAVDVDNSVTVNGFLAWEQPPSITGGNLDTTYFLQQLHFHWNSEHTFNGLHYDAELHLVHISDKYDPSLNMSLSGNVAVVAVPFQTGDPEAALDGIENLFVEENSTDPSEKISFSPSVLLPTDTKTFYRYSGSLTTPPCTEGVTWTILAEPVLLTADQLASLRGAQSQDDADDVHNSRKIQSMNGRKLYLNNKLVRGSKNFPRGRRVEQSIDYFWTARPVNDSTTSTDFMGDLQEDNVAQSESYDEFHNYATN
ncbi:carbonate dehydratase, eukaryotic-type [Ancylostoma duodenale]|uniref:carbonic anhydrase n=1 Tax=Ancylostoma duodenale TaxID=51022 RepID=A0A0C2D138_9BILA|nr:carbonate dehydratase, eukaryotic-type [Ancylostoma duodenale]